MIEFLLSLGLPAWAYFLIAFFWGLLAYFFLLLFLMRYK